MTTQTPQQELLTRHDYALVDRAAIVRESWHENLPWVPIFSHSLRHDVEKCPLLLPLQSLEKPQLAHLCDNLLVAEKQPKFRLFSSLIKVPPDTKQTSLEWHLRKILELHIPRPNVFALLRYYDARVFPHLYRILKTAPRPNILYALFGPITTWTFLFQNEWISVERPTVPEGANIPKYWAVEAKTWHQIERIGLLNATLRDFIGEINRPWSVLAEYNAIAEKADRALEIARNEYQLTDDDDREAFAMQSLMYGRHFYQHPRIQTLLHDAQQNQTSYASASALLGEQEWATIAAASR
jgi:hypothetical protein